MGSSTTACEISGGVSQETTRAWAARRPHLVRREGKYILVRDEEYHPRRHRKPSAPSRLHGSEPSPPAARAPDDEIRMSPRWLSRTEQCCGDVWNATGEARLRR